MSAILDKLDEIATPQTAAVYVRHQSKMQPSQLGFTAATIADWDNYTATRLDLRATLVESELDAISGELTFPFDTDDQAILWPKKSVEQRVAVLDDLLKLAAEATQQFVIGDLRKDADLRAGLQFSAQAKLDYENAKASLDAAKRKITNALNPPLAAVPTTVSQHRSVVVPVRAKW